MDLAANGPHLPGSESLIALAGAIEGKDEDGVILYAFSERSERSQEKSER